MRLLMSLLLVLLAANSLASAEVVFEGLPDGVAVLRVDRAAQVYAVVLGERGTVVRASGAKTQTIASGSIAGFDVAADGHFWIVRDSRIERHTPLEEGTLGAGVDSTELFHPTAKPGTVFASRWGEVWVENCKSKRNASGEFTASHLLDGEHSITPIYDCPFGNIWGTAAVNATVGQQLSVLPWAKRPNWQPEEVRTSQASERWLSHCVDDVGFVWLAGERTLLRVDPRAEPSKYPILNAPSAASITSVARIAGKQIVVGLSDGSIQEMAMTPTGESHWQPTAFQGSGPVRAMMHDSFGRMWVIAGDKLYRDDSHKRDWQEHWNEQPRMIAGNHDNIFARIGDTLYSAGGKTYFGRPASQWVNLNDIWSYDISTGQWHIAAPMLEPGKAYSGIAALDDELWLVGGLFRDAGSTKPTDSVEIFNPKLNKSRRGPTLDQPRGQVVALAVDNRLYAIGGETAAGNTDSVLSIGAGEKRWRIEPPAPGPIAQAAGCVVDGKIYVAAGSRSNCPGLFVYDPAKRLWDVIAHPSGAAPSAPLCAALGRDIWVLGGRGTTSGLTETRVYSTESQRWTEGPDLPIPISWGAAAEANGQLLIAGGAYEDPRVGSYFNSDRVFLLRKR